MRTGRNRAASPAVSSLRPPRFKGKPPSQQTPPSAQRPPPSQQLSQQQTPTVIPSSIPSQRPSEPEEAHDADPIEEFSEYEAEGAGTPDTVNGSQNAFQKMTSSQMSSGSQRFGGLKQPPKWSKEEDAVLIRGVREGWSATQIARELGPGHVRRTGSAIRGRKKALIEKFNLEVRAAKSTTLHVESRRRWTPAEMSTIQQGVRDGLDATALQQKLKDRTLKSIDHKIKRRKALSKDPIRNGAEPSAKKAKTKAPMIEKRKDEVPEPVTQDNGAGDEMVLDETEPNEIGQGTADPADQVMTDDVEEYPAYPPEPEPRTTTQTDNADASYTPIQDDFDFSAVSTAFVKLPTSAQPDNKAGRLRRPTAARKKATRRAAANPSKDATAHVRDTADIQDTTLNGNAEIVNDKDAAANQQEAIVHDQDRGVDNHHASLNGHDAAMDEPNVTANDQARTVDDDFAGLYGSDDDEEPKAKPQAQRRGLFDDWTQEQRWRDCLRVNGGDEEAARRHFKEANLTAGMYDAILRKDQATIEAIKAERRQIELREAIEEGRARRKVPLSDAAAAAGAEDVDDEVLREEDWEIFIDKEEDEWSLPSEDHSSVNDDDEEEDMIRDREIEEVEDEEDDLVADRRVEEVDNDEEEEENMIHDREIEEVEDEEAVYDAPPPLPGHHFTPIQGHHFTPIQAMRATVVDGGFPTPVPTSEKLTAYGIDSKQPSSSIPTAASETTAASVDSKRSRRRSRNATQRRQSGGSRSSRAQEGRSRPSMSEMGSAPGLMGPPPPINDADNPFMKIVRNAHIPSPPRRREEPVRRRGTPSPPAWFASDNESEDSSEESE
ncbi:hypothetical protein PRZ48_008711 [Zasmidium cellare]|uniref:Myb-like domain-containing protein n=1 Tax=Zasmidium cellare TaxID=395010 RepID=A0ABR0EG83_ZASCE|nr:hypothetical protein PRZ48_008711 [Zasmidium cellare]